MLRQLPSVARLRERLRYDEAVGELFWLSGRNAGRAVVGSVTPKGYRKIGIDGVVYMQHRVIWKMHYGLDPEFIDHIDGDPQNNRIENLRSVCAAENNRNMKMHCRNSSGRVGIGRRKNGRWFAQISEAGKVVYLGTFDTFEQAAEARSKAERALDFHHNHGRANA